MNASSSPVIHMTAVTKVYETGEVAVHALKGINFRVDPGQYVGIMGPSGSGKTTLMEILGCLSRPTSGKYEFGGEHVDELDDTSLAAARGERIGFVFQTFNLLPRLTALENVELPMLYRRVPRAERRRRAQELLEQVGLKERVQHRPPELSGGERQRVAIARALVNKPSVVLADEPTGNLDTATGDAILDLIGSFHRAGQTIVLVTHDPRVAQRVTRIVRLRDGLVESDEPMAG
jgi:putative ABC transport system ATP-binding protein